MNCKSKVSIKLIDLKDVGYFGSVKWQQLQRKHRGALGSAGERGPHSGSLPTCAPAVFT